MWAYVQTRIQIVKHNFVYTTVYLGLQAETCKGALIGFPLPET